MYEFTCPVCGKVTQVEKKWLVRTYCSQKCVARAREDRRKESSLKTIVGECVFMPEVIMCDRRDCENCGWNPEVAKARLDKIKESL